jgi:hypothetical protein
MSRPSIRIALVLMLAWLLSSCQMTVQLTTKLDARGGGTFTIGVTADKELRDQLRAAPDASSGLASVQGLFDGLRARGWRVAESQPSGGLAFTASKNFKSTAEFDALLADVRTARGGEAGTVGGISFDLGYETRREFLRTRTRFHGAFDTSGLKLDPEHADDRRCERRGVRSDRGVAAGARFVIRFLRHVLRAARRVLADDLDPSARAARRRGVVRVRTTAAGRRAARDRRRRA